MPWESAKKKGRQPGKSRPFSSLFGLSAREAFRRTNTEKALCHRTLVNPDSPRPLSHRYKLSICYWRSFKDFLAGLFLPALIAVMLLGGWVLLRVMVH